MDYRNYGMFELGQQVTYDVYPDGRFIPGVVISSGIQSTGDWAEYFKSIGVATEAEWAGIVNARPLEEHEPSTAPIERGIGNG